MSTVKYFSTSHLQQANWFLYKLNSTGLSDKISASIRIKSAVDIQAVKNTLQALTQRHSILCSIYYEQDEKIIQEVRETAKIDFENIDASSWNDEELNRQILQKAKQHFNLDAGAFRACLFSRSVSEHILLLAAHQIAADSESLLILVNDFVAIYESILNGNRPNLPPLNTSDRTNYIQKKLDFVNSESGKKVGDYWQQKLSDELPVLELPTNSARPTIRTYNGASIKFSIKPQLSQQIKQLDEAQAVTVEEILLAVFKVLLYRYTGEEDILVGLLQNRENKPLFKKVVGNLTNVTVVRDAIWGNLKFTDFLSKVSKTLFEIDKYKDYPFALLVKQIKSSDLSHPPICQAAFSYSKQKKSLEAKELKLEHYQLPQLHTDFELSLEVIELPESFEGYFKYNTDILEAATVAQIAEHFQNLLTAIVENPQTTVGKLPMLSDSEKQQILLEWNDTKKVYDNSYCLHQLFEAQVEKTPQTVAVVFEGTELTYRELNNRANQLAHYLQKLRVKPETKVGICVERSLEMVVGLLGIQKAGGAYLPIDPTYPTERINYILENSQVPVLLTQNHLRENLSEFQGTVIDLDSNWENIANESEENPVSNVTPDNLIYIIYTSGSTGKPKGTMNTHKGVVNRILWMQDEYQLTSGDRVLQKTPFSFDVSGWEFWWTLITGAILVVAKPEGHKDPNYLAKLIDSQQITTLHFVPSMLEIFLEVADIKSCRSLRQVFCSGEALSISLQQRFFAAVLKAQLHNLYGPTETAIDVTYWHCQPDTQYKSVPIGRPIANTQTYILNPDLQPVPIGVAGELYLGGVQLARGYLNHPELTAQKFINNPFVDDFKSPLLYKTGDLARYLPDGNIEYLGRLDNQVKIRGNRIELGEIESVLTQHHQVRESLVMAREDTPGVKRLVAYIVSGKSQPSITSLRESIASKLPDYMIPSAFVILSQLPLTANGKVNRRALPAPDISNFNQSDNFIAPRDRIEQKLAEIWSEILDINPVGVKDNFFELGGHSLLAINLMAKIQRRFDKQLPLSTLFTNRTVEDLSKLIREQKQQKTSSLVPIQTQGNKQAFFCVHPAGGHVLCYQELSHYLGNNQPFYGLQAQGFNRGEKVLTKVEDMAEFYVRNIQEFQPEGPLQIGGWSFGGVVAFEMAQQLLQQGREVSLLAILDSWVPILLDPNKKIDNLYLTGALSRYFGGAFGTENFVSEDELKGLNPEEKIEFIIDKAERAGLFPPEASREQNRRFIDVMVGTLKATYAYKRRSYPGKVTVFRPRERHFQAPDPQLVWVELYAILDAADVELQSVPGSHYSFVKQPNLKVLAERLKNSLK
ncbi:amino acid adenylation domain-containing protein [Calothrix sp. CCY 0018]|uniref:amino acid adenylation domain-containing protein n=1 Tax=Calothrix sp. CCY 0018 TaxID=3103864 RepID=UPI0039C7244E